MSRMDFTPVYRSTVGFDRMMPILDATLNRQAAIAAFPPYNIEKFGDDDYRITLAVAGFSMPDLDIEVRENMLFVRDRTEQPKESGEFLYRGIAGRRFERQFVLADHVHVAGAHLADGLLSIDLERQLPERLRPRNIAINSAPPPALPNGRDAVTEDKEAA